MSHLLNYLHDEKLDRTVQVLVKPNPDIKDLETRGTLVIGLGDPSEQSRSAACILNYKNQTIRNTTTRLKSVSEFIFHAPEELVNSWKEKLEQEDGTKKLIIVEDLSLDTCFSLVLLFLRLFDHDDAIDWKLKSEKWVNYVTRWEEGQYPDDDKVPRESVACLASLLGHSYLGSNQAQEGLIACCEFLGNLVEQFEDPFKVVFDRNHRDKNFARAIGRYEYEEDRFELVVRHSTKFQLQIPVCGSHEKVLTDAIILDETEPSGMLKWLLRKDKKHSWTKRGFGLIAVYRKNEAMTGNDMTISVDADRNLSLNELWENLEKLEENAWSGQRPRGVGRMLASYENRSDIDKNNIPIEPWYDGRGGGQPCSTLVAAPKGIPREEVQGGRICGSKLDWNINVLPALWKIYSPIQSELTAKKRIQKSGRLVTIVKWNPKVDLYVAYSPTFMAWLAAQSRKVILESPTDLPSADAFEVLYIKGGWAIVHREGVTIFEDWSSKLEKDELISAAENVDLRIYKLNEFINKDEYRSAVSFLNELKSSHRFPMKKFKKWKEGVVDLKAELLGITDHRGVSETKKGGNSLSKIESTDALKLRDLLDKSWGLEENIKRTREIMVQTDEVTGEIFQQLRESNSKFVNTIIAGLGIGVLLRESLEIFKDYSTMNNYEWTLEVFKKNSKLEILQSIADKVGLWESITLWSFLIGFIIGAFIYWVYGSTGGQED